MSECSDISAVVLTYEELVQHLMPLELLVDVSQLHGILTGCLVSGGQSQAEHYLRSVLLSKTGVSYRDSQNALFVLYHMTQAWLNNFGFDFRLMIPQDSEALMSRVAAFVHWCQGFLQGFEMTDMMMDEIDNENVLEILQHLDEFSQMDAENFEYEDEADERAFLELTEYTRLAVLEILCVLNEPDTTQLHH